MNGSAIFRDQYRPLRGFCGAPVASGGETMDALTATIIAVGGSLIVIVIAGAMAVMADRAILPVLTLPVEATAAALTAGEVATVVAAEAINPTLFYRDRCGR